MDDLAKILSDEFREKRAKFPKTVLFCQHYTDCSACITCKKLGSRLTEPPEYPDLSEEWLSSIPKCLNRQKEKLLWSDLVNQKYFKIVIATMSFGIGTNCSDLHCVIHWGLLRTIEDYVQETGRVGLDEKLKENKATTLPRK